MLVTGCRKPCCFVASLRASLRTRQSLEGLQRKLCCLPRPQRICIGRRLTGPTLRGKENESLEDERERILILMA